MAGRRPSYLSEDEKPVSVSLRIPRDVYDQAQRYVGMRRTTLTEVLLDGLRLRLETPADPRDKRVSDASNTVIQELQEMIDAAVQAALVKARDMATSAPEATAPPINGIQYDRNAVLQDRGVPIGDEWIPFDEDLAEAPEALAGPTPDIRHDDTPGVQDTAPAAPDAIEAQIDQHITRLEHRVHEMQCLDGENEDTVPQISHDDTTVVQPRVARQPILDLLRQHPAGLTAVQIKGHLGVSTTIGETLAGLVQDHVLEKRSGKGAGVKYGVRESL